MNEDSNMEKYPAEEILTMMMDCLISNLEECEEEEQKGKLSEFAYGSKTAYVEMLELIQRWEKAEEYGLDWDIEENFPVWILVRKKLQKEFL